MRHRLLETVRQYAREKLAESETARRFGNGTATIFGAGGRGGIQTVGTGAGREAAATEEEHENLRAGLEWGLAKRIQGNAAALRSAATLWITRGHFAEGREWCARALQMPDREAVARACERTKRGHARSSSKRPARAAALLEECSTNGNWVTSRIAIVLGNLGPCLRAGDFSAARALHEESLEIMRELVMARHCRRIEQPCRRGLSARRSRFGARCSSKGCDQGQSGISVSQLL